MLKPLMLVGIVLVILASIVEVIVDVRDIEIDPFLPQRLAELPSSEPATALGAVGVVVLTVAMLLQWVTMAFPGGLVIIGLIAVLAFLLTGGFIISEE